MNVGNYEASLHTSLYSDLLQLGPFTCTYYNLVGYIHHPQPTVSLYHD